MPLTGEDRQLASNASNWWEAKTTGVEIFTMQCKRLVGRKFNLSNITNILVLPKKNAKQETEGYFQCDYETFYAIEHEKGAYLCGYFCAGVLLANNLLNDIHPSTLIWRGQINCVA